MPDILVAMGASQGGVLALRKVISGLPGDFPAAILIVQHIGPEESELPSLLTEVGNLAATHAQNGERIRAGHIHVAPPNRHMIVADGRVELSRGPRENWARPAIDPLFRSAAEAYGKCAIGVLLTGQLNDGTTGLYELKRRGGTTIVQDPSEAEASSMPRSALDNVAIDFCLPLSRIGEKINYLARSKERDWVTSGP